MRLYSFVIGLYMSPIQHGIQTGHLAVDMAEQYPKSSKRGKVFHEWATKHKTMIVCSAVTAGGVLRAHEQFQKFGIDFNLPTGFFCEDEESLGGIMTACGIVVPEKYYDAQFVKGREPQDSMYVYTAPDGTEKVYLSMSLEYAFVSALKSYRLA